MNQKTLDILLTISCTVLAIGGLIFLAISMFGKTRDNWTLNFSLAIIYLANLFNLIRIQRNRKKE